MDDRLNLTVTGCDDISTMEMAQRDRDSSSTSPVGTSQLDEGMAKEVKSGRTRRMTEKRKMQNRESQRTYRERQKKYIENLKRAASGAIPVVENGSKEKRTLLPQPRQNDTPGGVTAALPFPPIPDAHPRLGMLPNLPASPKSFYQPNYPTQYVEAIGPTASPSFIPDPSHVTSQTPSLGFAENMGQWEVVLDDDLDMTLPSNDLGALQVFNNGVDDYSFLRASSNEFPPIPLRDNSSPDIFSSTEDTAMMEPIATSSLEERDTLQDPHDPIAWALTANPPTSRPRSSLSALDNDTLSNVEADRRLSEDDTGPLDTLQLLRIDKNKENRALLREAMTQDHSLGEIFLAGLRVIGGQSSSSRGFQYRGISPVADLHVNRLRLLRVRTINAYFANAQALHFPIENFTNNSSPFYRPEATTTVELDRIMTIIADPLPKDLRPTYPQFMYDHNPFLDVLPFPTLRARAIMFASCTPPLIDLLELKKDIVNDGLVCWKASQHGTGQPWDMRSWEAAPWFLDKWRILVGSEEDEVRAQSKWWRRLRGDERSIAQ